MNRTTVDLPAANAAGTLKAPPQRPHARRRTRTVECRAPAPLLPHERRLVDAALGMLSGKMRRPGALAADGALADLKDMARFVTAGRRDSNDFGVMFFDQQLRLVDLDGAISGLRDIVKRAEQVQATAVILILTSTSPECSEDAVQLIALLQAAFDLGGVLVYDHFRVCGDEVISFAEHGLLQGPHA